MTKAEKYKIRLKDSIKNLRDAQKHPDYKWSANVIRKYHPPPHEKGIGGYFCYFKKGNCLEMLSFDAQKNLIC